MNPVLAFGQIIVSIALIAAILLQARGTGLSGTFGGDSAVYRSRRGVERRLWQFTIVLLVLFVTFSLASFVLARRRLSGAPRLPGAAADARRLMTRIDTFVVGTLVLLLAVVAGLIGVPASADRTHRRARRPEPRPLVEARPYARASSAPPSRSPR